MAVTPSAAAADATVLAEPPPGSPERSTARSPEIAPTPREGGFLLVYESPVGPGRHEIRARRLDAAGRPAGEPVVVAAPPFPERRLASPRMAYDPEGDAFLVVWREMKGTEEIAWDNGGRVRARRVNAQGVPTSRTVTLASHTPGLNDVDVDFDRSHGVWAVAWSSRSAARSTHSGVIARRIGAGAEKVGGPRALATETDPSEVTVAATRGSFLIAWVRPAGRRFSAIYARTFGTDSSRSGPRTRIAVPRERGATASLVSDLDLAYDTRRRRLALAYSNWWDTSLGEGDTEVDVQRLTPSRARIGAPAWLDVELNAENLAQTRIAYSRASDRYRLVWWYEEIPSGPVCRDTQIRTGAISGAWKRLPPQNAISKDSDPGGPPQPNAGGAQCRVPPEQPAVAPAGDGGWLAAWTREPYVLGLRLGP
jgi:hypothetical protein